MIEKRVTVKLKDGFHARVAAQFVKGIIQYDCDVEFYRNGRFINPKHLLHLTAASIKENDEIDVKVEGNDEQEVMEYIEKFLSGKIAEVSQNYYKI